MALRLKNREACRWKVKHATREQAWAEVCRMFKPNGERVVALYCPFCQGWHLAHLKPGRKGRG